LSKDGKEGSGGLEAVVAGGMHTLAVDEAGKVSTGYTTVLHCLAELTLLDLVMGYQ
jgi:hypothetical protein